jgi:hypothetical protein
VADCLLDLDYARTTWILASRIAVFHVSRKSGPGWLVHARVDGPVVLTMACLLN